MACSIYSLSMRWPDHCWLGLEEASLLWLTQCTWLKALGNAWSLFFWYEVVAARCLFRPFVNSLSGKPTLPGPSRVSLDGSFWQSGSSIPVPWPDALPKLCPLLLAPLFTVPFYLWGTAAFSTPSSWAWRQGVDGFHAVGRAQLTVLSLIRWRITCRKPETSSFPHSCYLFLALCWDLATVSGARRYFVWISQQSSSEIFIYLACYDAVIPCSSIPSTSQNGLGKSILINDMERWITGIYLLWNSCLNQSLLIKWHWCVSTNTIFLVKTWRKLLKNSGFSKLSYCAL